jgi:hypothetical protein
MFPGFPVEIGGFGELHAPLLTERRTRGSGPKPRNRKSGFAPAYVGRKRWGAAPSKSFRYAPKILFPAEQSKTKVKAFEKHRFRPMYAAANMGHPSRTANDGVKIDCCWDTPVATVTWMQSPAVVTVFLNEINAKTFTTPLIWTALTFRSPLRGWNLKALAVLTKTLKPDVRTRLWGPSA